MLRSCQIKLLRLVSFNILSNIIKANEAISMESICEWPSGPAGLGRI